MTVGLTRQCHTERIKANKKNIKSAYQHMKELPLELGIHPNNHNLATLILLYIAHFVLQ